MRVAVLRLETKDQGTISIIINKYALTSAATDEEREEFDKLFERTVNDEKGYYKLIVGDLNARPRLMEARTTWNFLKKQKRERLIDFLSA
ncbi:unnamed protein product [Heligmosomoides polygyrus]|uniref:Endo/exonuclease/phosphatase domain-containing protein n=1 Tax=Heligmosomoides polygyrus TaxID=6339 RepID=A0A183FIN7_HELPZ|nr:unnamed protein product [Heligmosomoides polygyrus]